MWRAAAKDEVLLELTVEAPCECIVTFNVVTFNVVTFNVRDFAGVE